jgi:hypothetical protein
MVTLRPPTVKLRLAGVWSSWPARSRALTAKTCGPCARFASRVVVSEGEGARDGREVAGRVLRRGGQRVHSVADAGRVRHDVSVADLYHDDFPVNTDNERLIKLTTADGTFGNDPARVAYYFGNLDERRVVWSRNRDLVMTPRQDSEPVNALPKAHVEIDGKVHPEGSGWVRKLAYRE